jgi:large subunit ribosomal protein L28
MAFRCDVCGKGPVAGKSISHSHKTTNRRFLPNLKRQKVVLNGVTQRMKVCTRCLRSHKVTKVGPRHLIAAA